MSFFKLFSRSNPPDYDRIIAILEDEDPNEVKKLMWGVESNNVNYLEATVGLIQRMKKNQESGDHLTIHKKMQGGNFELVIFHQPWPDSKIPFSPLIFDQRNGKIVGIMLPFNELHGLLSRRDSKEIGDLGAEWVKFTFPYHFGNKKA